MSDKLDKLEEFADTALSGTRERFDGPLPSEKDTATFRSQDIVESDGKRGQEVKAKLDQIKR